MKKFYLIFIKIKLINEINVNFNFKQLKKLKMEKYYLDLILKEENDII